MSIERDTFIDQAQEVINLARLISGADHAVERTEQVLKTLNGLLAIALTEFCAPPYINGTVRLRDAIKEETDTNAY